MLVRVVAQSSLHEASRLLQDRKSVPNYPALPYITCNKHLYHACVNTMDIIHNSTLLYYHLFSADDSETLKLALDSLLKDNSFKTPVRQTRAAIDTATALVSWSTQNQSQFSAFATELTALLRTCFVSAKSLKLRKEKM